MKIERQGFSSLPFSFLWCRFEKQEDVIAQTSWCPKRVGFPKLARGGDKFVQILWKACHIIRVQTPPEHIA
jgi:hypothetical protein